MNFAYFYASGKMKERALEGQCLLLKSRQDIQGQMPPDQERKAGKL